MFTQFLLCNLGLLLTFKALLLIRFCCSDLSTFGWIRCTKKRNAPLYSINTSKEIKCKQWKAHEQHISMIAACHWLICTTRLIMTDLNVYSSLWNESFERCMKWEAVTSSQLRGALWLFSGVCVSLHTLTQQYHSEVESLSTLIGESLLICFSALHRSLSSFPSSLNLSIILSVPDLRCHSLSISPWLAQTLHPLLSLLPLIPPSSSTSLHLFLSSSTPPKSPPKSPSLRALFFLMFVSFWDTVAGLSFQFCDAWRVPHDSWDPQGLWVTLIRLRGPMGSTHVHSHKCSHRESWRL